MNPSHSPKLSPLSSQSPPSSVSAPVRSADPARAARIGAALIIAGAVAFSSKAVMVKMAYAVDPSITPITIMAVRMAFALPLFVLSAWWVVRRGVAKGNGRVSIGDGLRIGGLGMLGYYVAMYMDFAGLSYISAGLERLILFVFPTMVVLLSAWKSSQRVPVRTRVALAVTYFGVAIAVAGSVQMSGSPSDLLIGSLLVLGSALAFALFNVGAESMIRKVGPARFTAISMVWASLASLTHFAVVQLPQSRDLWPQLPAEALTELTLICAVMAVVATVVPSFLISAGVARLGAGRAAIIGSVGPVATFVMAGMVLGEVVTMAQVVGGVVVVAGVITVTRQ